MFFEKESVIFQIEMKPCNTGKCIEKVWRYQRGNLES